MPEAGDYIASSPAETVSLARSTEDSIFVKGLQHEASQAGLAINVGIHEPATGGKRVKNTLIWIDEGGSITHRYQKLHLFDVEIKDGPVLKESKSVEPGSSIVPPFPTSLGSMGLMICFDLRFPALSARLRDVGAQMITYPSAFTVPTGKVHWETLLRARAIETQSYVIAAAQVGTHNEKRVSYGHSMIVDPWGKVVAEAGGVEEWKGEPEIIVGEVDLGFLQKVRREMPLHPRRDVVDVVETSSKSNRCE